MTKAAGSRRARGVPAIKLLEAIVNSGSPSGVKELAGVTDTDPGQTHRLLRGLLDAGYIAQDMGGRYSPTARIIQLAGSLLRHLEIVTASRDELLALRDETGETVHLADASGELPICVSRELSRSPVSAVTSVGELWPLETTAVGQAIAAHREGEFKHSELADQIRSRGYAVDFGGFRDGVTSIASVVIAWDRRVVGAIAASGPRSRMEERGIDEAARLVVSAAQRISIRLGAPGSEAQR